MLQTILSAISWRADEPKDGSVSTLIGHTGTVCSLLVLTNGWLVSGSADYSIKIWDVKAESCIAMLSGHSNWVRCLAELESECFASGSDDLTIKIWDTKSFVCLKTLLGHSNWVRALASLPVFCFASGSDDKSIRIWDVTSGRMKSSLVGHGGNINCLKLLPDGRLASCSDDKTIKLWDIEACRCVVTLRGHGHSVLSLVVMDDRRLASCSADFTIKLWDVDHDQCLTTIEEHTAIVRCLAVLPDKTLVSGSEDKTIKRWEVTSERCLSTSFGHADWIYALAVLPSGNTIASGSKDNTIKFWQYSPPKPPKSAGAVGLQQSKAKETLLSELSQPASNVMIASIEPASASTTETIAETTDVSSDSFFSPSLESLPSSSSSSSSSASASSSSFCSSSEEASCISIPLAKFSAVAVPTEAMSSRIQTSKQAHTNRDDYSSIGFVRENMDVSFHDSYVPDISCLEFMRMTLPGLIPAVNVEYITEGSLRVAESCLDHLPTDVCRLSLDEALAVAAYSFDLQYNTIDGGKDNFYYQLNEMLRKRTKAIIDSLRVYLFYLMKGLSKLPQYRGVVYRGIPKDQLTIIQEKYRLGCAIHWSAVTSTTNDIGMAKNFAGAGGIIFHIKCQNGRKIDAYSAFANENEIILSPNARFFVSSECELQSDGYYKVELVERSLTTVVY